jgi:hypothetical protein
MAIDADHPAVRLAEAHRPGPHRHTVADVGPSADAVGHGQHGDQAAALVHVLNGGGLGLQRDTAPGHHGGGVQAGMAGGHAVASWGTARIGTGGAGGVSGVVSWPGTLAFSHSSTSKACRLPAGHASFWDSRALMADM